MKEMNPSRINNRILLSIIAVVIIITATAIFVFASMSKWEQEMVEKNMALCESYARGLLEASEGDLEVLGVSRSAELRQPQFLRDEAS